ncbi:MAG: GNAT family N-acetyltransferase [Ruminococcaceae bacterium]|nr:GNAT family N-acetyltransferase [Oscillospiraceae bacterium]
MCSFPAKQSTRASGYLECEAAYHFVGERPPYRGKGYGRKGLLLLCEAAKANGIKRVCFGKRSCELNKFRFIKQIK